MDIWFTLFLGGLLEEHPDSIGGFCPGGHLISHIAALFPNFHRAMK
jgi:hypothetical protein